MEIKLSDKVYNAVKWITMILLPAIATLYVGLSNTWNFPFPGQISATITAIIVFLGLFLQVNSAQFRLRVAIKNDRDLTDSMRLRLRLVMSDSTYDTLKWVATILLPSVSTLYVAIAGVWNLPHAEYVSGTIASIVVFMATILQISSLEYKRSMLVLMGASLPRIYTSSWFSISQEKYDMFKFIAQGIFPGIAAFYFALASIWGLPYGEQVSATAMAISLFMNALLQISTAKYNAAIKAIMK